MKTARSLRRRQWPVSYALLMSIPAAVAALAIAPSAAADTPVVSCTANQSAQNDNCIPAPPPSQGCGGIMCLTANGAQDVYSNDYPPLPAGNPPAWAPDANGPDTPPLAPPPNAGCSGIACLTANGAQDAYAP
jgi:hypothetical protein